MNLNTTTPYLLWTFYLLGISTTRIHIENSFNLQYPKSFIGFAKSKALKIHTNNIYIYNIGK